MNNDQNKGSSSQRGVPSEQPAEAGRQSHKNDDKKSGSTGAKSSSPSNKK